MTATDRPTADDTGRVVLLPTRDTEPPPLEADPPPDDYQPARRDQPADPATSHDYDAEQQILGAALTDSRALDQLTTLIDARDFHDPHHETIWHTIIGLRADGTPIDTITVAAHLQTTKARIPGGIAPTLHNLTRGLITSANADYHARILKEHTHRRDYTQAAQRMLQHAAGDPIDALTRATLELGQLREQLTNGHDETLTENIHDFLAHAGDDDPPEWLIDGILERGDRLIVTAGEGHGKSTLLRQMAVQSAAGIHPFTLEPIDPIRVLIVDLENSERQTRRELRPLTFQANSRLLRDQLHVVVKIDGLDLGDATDLAWLDRAIEQTRPDLLVTGPIYKMATGNPNEEKEAKPIAMGLDHLRARHGIAVILEAHSAKTPAGMNPRNRPKEPFGWSGWMRWPEFGLHLAEDGTLTAWRGGRDRHTRHWPDTLNRGGRWPWTPGELPDAGPGARWLKIRGAIIRAGGTRLSARELSDQIGVHHSTIARDLQAHTQEIAELYAQLEEQR